MAFKDFTVKAKVAGGRLIVNAPTDLPDGTELDLVPSDPGDDLDEDERARLHKALDQGLEDLKAGRLIDADVVLEKLRRP